MNDELLFQILMISGIFLGNLFGLLLPYFRKLSEGKIVSFEIKYAYHSVVSLFWQSVLTFSLWDTLTIPSGLTWVWAFLLAIAFGFGGKDMQEQLTKLIERKKFNNPVIAETSQ